MLNGRITTGRRYTQSIIFSLSAPDVKWFRSCCNKMYIYNISWWSGIGSIRYQNQAAKETQVAKDHDVSLYRDDRSSERSSRGLSRCVTTCTVQRYVNQPVWGAIPISFLGSWYSSTGRLIWYTYLLRSLTRRLSRAGNIVGTNFKAIAFMWRSTLVLGN